MVKVTSIEYIDIEGEGVDVYDVEVPIDESFISNGVVLHNSPICQAIDHRIVPLDSPLNPPFHVNCRTSVVFILKKEFRGDQSGSKRRAGKERIDAKMSYYDWLLTQSKEFQDDVLGKTRAKLLRDGGLSAEQFAKLSLDKNFNPLTLKQMKAKNPLIFEKAGL